jgi:hypothetical protein
MSGKRTGRPVGTTRRLKSPPLDVHAAAVRALLPAGFPIELGRLLVEIMSLRAAVANYKDSTAVIQMFDGPPVKRKGAPARYPSRTIDLRDVWKKRLSELEATLGLQCQMAFLRLDAGVFKAMAVAAKCLSNQSKRYKLKTQVCAAFFTLRNSEAGAPTELEIKRFVDPKGKTSLTVTQIRDVLVKAGLKGI